MRHLDSNHKYDIQSVICFSYLKTMSRLRILKVILACAIILFILYESSTIKSSVLLQSTQTPEEIKTSTRPPCEMIQPSNNATQNVTHNPLLTFYGHKSLLKSPEAFRPNKTKITPLNYNFTINSPPACPATSHNPTLFILILTQHEHYTQRKAIRETWGRIARNQPWPGRRLLGEVRLIFLLGEIDNVEVNKEVESEANLHKDIVEANFKDSYFNLTYKVLMGMKWVQTYCPNTKYVMKMDHDAFVDIPRVLNVLVSTSLLNMIYGTFSYSEKVDRSTRKGAVSVKGYSPEWYPPHVKGNSYIMPYTLAMNILNVSEYFPYVNIEDAYITGVLAKVFDARHIEIPDELYDKYPKQDVEVCAFVLGNKLSAQKVYPKLLYQIWEKIENPEQCGVTGVYTAVKDYGTNKSSKSEKLTITGT